MNFLKKNSWTLDLAKIPSYVEWNGDWKYEIDREMIRLILECEELDKDGNPVITQKMKTHFKNNIVDKLRNGELHIEWSARYGGMGRRYSARDPEDPDPFSSAGNLGSHAKVIKNTLFHYQGWVDYDMIKGHPTLLLEMAKHTKLTGGLPAVERYVADFDTYLAEEMIEHYSAKGDDEEETKKYRLTKDDIKDLHNRTIYGGGHDKWVKKIEKGDEKKGKLPKPCNPFIHDKYGEFRTDIQRVIGLVYDSNPDLVAKVCINPPAPKPALELWQKKNRTMSYFCCILENECLKHAYKYGVENGLFKARRIDLCYDGFTAPAPPAFTDMPFHINEMNNYILEKTGFAVKMKVKGFEKVVQSLLDARRAVPNAVPAQALVELIVEGTEDVSAQASTNTDQEYLDWKIRFENEWCKIKNTAVFMRKFKEDGVFKKFIFQDKKKLVIAYEHECYTKTLDNGKEKKIKYINEWIEDPNQITYEDVGVFPPPLVCPEKVFNLWIPSPYESQPFQEGEDPDIDNEAIELFTTHIDIICGRDAKQTEWLCSWFAHSLQKPCEKPEHALNLIGNQGTGKSTILNTFTKLYGAGKTMETQSPELDCWGSFNSAMTNSFLVILSETDKRNAYGADGKVKAIITDYPMRINPKGKDPFEVMSYHRVVQLTNNIDPTRTSKDDRRNWILRCNDELKGNTEYFKKLNKALDRPNALRSIYWSFKNFDISQWDFRNVPKTKYHETIIEYSRNPLSIFLEHFVIQRITHKIVEITGPDLLKEFRLWRETTGYKFDDSMNEGVLLKGLKIGCGLPNNSIIRSEKRTKSGYKQYIDIDILKEYFQIGCLIWNGNEQVNTKEDNEVVAVEETKEPEVITEPVKPKKVFKKVVKG